MNPRQFHQLLHLAAALPAQLRQPVTRATALARLRDGLRDREHNFLTAARRLIYDNPVSPYRLLLLWADCRFPDLERSVQSIGLERTLQKLREAGVYLTLSEFKRQTPIYRTGLTLTPRATDFNNPCLSAAGIEGSTSGTRSPATPVFYDWDFIAEEAAHELLLYDHLGVLDAPTALWYPVLPGLAGVHNLMMNLKHGHPPARWFSHLDPASSQISLLHRLALTGVRWSSRLAGFRAPRPERAEVSQPDNVLNWMQGNPGCVVRTFASSAMRLVQHAQRNGVDITGATFFTGGEPLTDARRRFIESAGANAYPRYVASESGLIAAACRHRAATDDMHVYTDRIAVIPGLFFTTLSLHTGKVLFNTELGDTGDLSTRPCDCVFGELGFNLHLTNVRSRQRLTIEGMTVAVWELDAIVAPLIEQAGGNPDAYQYRLAQNERGLTRLVISVSPELTGLDPGTFLQAIYVQMRQRHPGLAVAAEVWQQAAALQIVHERPMLTPGHKLASLIEH